MPRAPKEPKAAKAESGKATKTKRTPKAKKEPGAKKAPSAYIIFCGDKRGEIKENNPEATFGELGKLLGKMWAELTEEEKQVRI